MNVLRKYFSGTRTWWSILVLVGITAIATAVALLVQTEGRGYFKDAGNDPQKVYEAYLEHVAEYERELAGDEDYNWVGIMRGMTREAVPMIAQLPEEMPDKEKARLLKSYYGDILAGVEKLKNAK